jgi:galactokinase
VREKVAVRSPGRVNLIGEHTDYSLLPVMPVAIDRHVRFTGELGPIGHVRAISATQPDEFVLDLAASPRRHGGWHRYLAAAIDAVGPDSRGATLYVEADLPDTGGLSSSSAFTVGALSFLNALWGRGLSKEDIRQLAIVTERAVGVESGGMDQTVITLAEPGGALRIDFDPFAVRQVPIPDEIRIVAAYSGSMAPKGGSARHAYNTGVVACRAAAVLLGRDLGVAVRTPPVLKDVHSAATPDDVSALPEETTAREAADNAGIRLSDLVSLTAATFDADERLPVRAVAAHVLSEAVRVDEAEVALAQGSLSDLGRLLDQSHASLQSFGASTPALDQLTAAMRSSGAAGARITGAGFGGYALAVCRPDAVDDVRAASVEATGGPAFEVTPSAGVEVVESLSGGV